MDAKYLDSLLVEINKARNSEVNKIFPKDLFKPELISGINYLQNKGYIGQAKYSVSDLSHWSVSIREEGEAFLASGGFTKEQERKDSPLDANIIGKESNRLAKWAICISIAAFIVSIIAIILQATFH